MKKKIYFLSLFFIIACVNNKGVYWCGDHPCINNKEKEAYFKKTMIVEIKDISKSKKNNSEIEKITQQARLNEKKRIKEEKDLEKQIKLEEKKRIKENKKLSRKKIDKNQKRHLKKSTELDTNIINTEIKLSKFSKLAEKIDKENTLRPYPDINDIPN